MTTTRLDDRRRRMVEENLGLAFMHALRQPGSVGLDRDDMAQEAAIGLMIASGKFDGRRGLKFTTYASWWCRQRINRARWDPGVIHVPEYNRRWKDEAHTVHVERARSVVSMSEPIPGDGMRATVGDTIPAPEAEESPYAGEMETLPGHLDALDGRQSEIIWRVFWEGQTLAEVGEAIGLSAARVDQIKDEALDRLRAGYGLMPHATARAIDARRRWTERRRREREREAKAAGRPIDAEPTAYRTGIDIGGDRPA